MKRRNIIPFCVVLMVTSVLAGISFTGCRSALIGSISSAFSAVVPTPKIRMIGDFPPYRP
jgi:hypothetical protein